MNHGCICRNRNFCSGPCRRRQQLPDQSPDILLYQLRKPVKITALCRLDPADDIRAVKALSVQAGNRLDHPALCQIRQRKGECSRPKVQGDPIAMAWLRLLFCVRPSCQDLKIFFPVIRNLDADRTGRALQAGKSPALLKLLPRKDFSFPF